MTKTTAMTNRRNDKDGRNDKTMPRISLVGHSAPCYRRRMRTLSGRDWVLLVLVTLFWGINWPIMKIGVTAFPPLTFRTLCMIGAIPTIWLAARMSGTSPVSYTHLTLPTNREV